MNPLAELSAARSLLDANNHDGAMRRVDAVLKDHPDFAMALSLAVAIEFNRSNYAAALQRAHRYLAINPDDPEIRSCEAVCLIRLKRRKEAAKAFKRFQMDFPDRQSDIDAIAAHLHLHAGKRRKANKKLHDLRKTSHGKGDLKVIAIVLHKMGDLFAAHNLLLEAVKEVPNDYDVTAALASSCLQLGRLSKARHFARMAQLLEPGNPSPKQLFMLSYLLYFPPFYLILIGSSTYQYVKCKLHWTLAFVAALMPFLPAVRSLEFSFHPIEILLQFRIPGYVSTICLAMVWYGIMSVSEKIQQSNLKRPVKPQRLRNY